MQITERSDGSLTTSLVPLPTGPCLWIVRRYKYRKPLACGNLPTALREVSTGRNIVTAPLCEEHAQKALPVRH